MLRLPLRSALAGASFVVCVSFTLVCSRVPTPQTQRQVDDERRASLRRGAAASGPVVFPPDDPEAWSARRPLPDDVAPSALHVAEPSLDADGAFKLEGQDLRVTFSEDVAPRVKGRPLAPPPKGALVVTPAIPGTLTWADPRTLEFRAARPFDPSTTYEVKVTTPASSPRTLDGAWQAKFQAVPRVEVAGKIIDYIPKAGAPRVIAVHPSTGETIGPSSEVSVVFDQPVELGRARALVRLLGDDKSDLAITVRHPGSPSFHGVKLDPRVVVLARPTHALKSGDDVTLRAIDGAADPGPAHEGEYKVASKLARTEVRCDGYGGGRDACDVKGDVVKTSGKEIDVVFNNPIAMTDAELAARVSVAPPVKNLLVRHEYWDGARVSISGELLPSTRYTVSVSGVRDAYGGELEAPVRLAVETLALPATLSMPEGSLLLDAGPHRSIPVTTRNLLEVEVAAWEVAGNDPAAFRRAVEGVRLHRTPDDEPVRTVVPVAARRDALVRTEVDLASKLAVGKVYVVRVSPSRTGWDAPETAYAPDSEAAHAPVALVAMGDDKTLAVHARTLRDATLVHVARLGSGEPVPGATVAVGALTAHTDDRGVALLRGERPADAVVQVSAGDAHAMLALTEGGVGAKDLFPDLATDVDAPSSAVRGVILSDRGVYRPGSKVMVKGNVRRLAGDALIAEAGMGVRVTLVDPAGGTVYSEAATTSDAGSVAATIDLEASAKIGRYRLRLEDPAHAEPPIADATIQVADFEPPRFKVDVESPAGGAGDKLHAVVRAKYLFGAPMDGASVAWTLRRTAAEFPHGPLTDAGLLFRKQRRWYEEDAEARATYTRTGEGALRADGTLPVDVSLPLAAGEGPAEFVLEADVADSSYRHVAGRATVTKNPASRYAGVRVAESWVQVGEPVAAELGVIDTEGKPVVGVSVVARLVRVDWTYTQRRAASGGLETRWIQTGHDAGSCSAVTQASPVPCALAIPSSGDYEVRAEVDGQVSGVASIWAWRYGETRRATFPTKGRALEVRADKGRYRTGDKARVFARNPYPAATAILTTESGGLVAYESKRTTDAAVAFDVPISAASAPYVHAVVTLLPIGATGEAAVDSKIGAVRLAVAEDDLRLDVAVRSDKPSYLPGEEASIDVEVKDAKAAAAGAEIALAVVDEGVLRLSGFHAVDPTVALRPGHPLAFRAYDTRQDLAEWLNRSHVAGDGGGDASAASIVAARKNFVQTALWIPALKTDAQGRATAKLHLPDNLTEFRMMAVVIGPQGKAAAAESSFTVNKPLMLIPVVPRFALVGDRFEAAAMLHNNTPQKVLATVSLGEEKLDVAVPAQGHERVAFPMRADRAGERSLSFRLDALGRRVDEVVAKLRVEVPGYEERPRLSGSFAGAQEVALRVPSDVDLSGDEIVSVEVGENLWPELGARMEYLLEYPHGCVEQTTSSTLPLLAARTILPRIGHVGLGAAELDKRILSGLARLASMRTSSGGLAYWPGGTEANVFGTAYASRAVVLAKAAGLEPPAGLLEGMQRYLADMLLSPAIGPEVAAAIAETLAESGLLASSAADALFDTRPKQSTFGLASLALALSALPGQDDRVASLLDDVEASFGDGVTLLKSPTSNDFYYYGSPTRTRAQAAIALARLRPEAAVLPRLLDDLVQGTGTYQTQATAWSLLAVAEHLAGAPKTGADVTATLDGVPLASVEDLGLGSKEFRVPAAALVGRTAKLHLEAGRGASLGFMVKSRWKRPLSSAAAHLAARTRVGLDVYRAYADAKGRPVDLSQVHAGDVVRVLVAARLPDDDVVDRVRRGYVAITDKIAGGFEPVDPDLATVARPPQLDDAAPFARFFRDAAGAADHVELHDDRVNIYFDHPWGDVVTASYLVRATTPGAFVIPPASAELMYEPGSEGYSDAQKVTIL